MFNLIEQVPDRLYLMQHYLPLMNNNESDDLLELKLSVFMEDTKLGEVASSETPLANNNEQFFADGFKD